MRGVGNVHYRLGRFMHMFSGYVTSPSMVYRVRKQLVEEGFEAVLSRKPRAMPAVARIDIRARGCWPALHCDDQSIPRWPDRRNISKQSQEQQCPDTNARDSAIVCSIALQRA